MQSEFVTYLRLGLHHIADIRAYDHILFIAALTAPYAPADWRRLLWLVTAFTLGHSVTLALATLRLVQVNATLVEVLIPVTILATATLTIATQRRPDAPPLEGRQTARYAMALGFGLIHGLGFSTFLRSLLGSEASIALPLFSFNLGLEVGQLLIVVTVLGMGVLVKRLLGLARHEWLLVLSGGAAGIAVTLIIDRLHGAG